MPKNVKQIRILIACPSDVENIKDIIDEMCVSANLELREIEGIEFKVIHWKKDVSSQITGERPQSIINKQFDDYQCDMFIAIFWKKFGSKQINDKTPTEEEFERNFKTYMEAGSPKIVKVYFKEDSRDPNNYEEALQIAEIFSFKGRIQDVGIYSSFKEKDFHTFFIRELFRFIKAFKEPVSKQLINKLNKYDIHLDYIERKLRKPEQNKIYPWLKPEGITTREIINNTNHIVLLGDAGTGKTKEINFLAGFYSEDTNPYFPVKIELKNYVDQDIEDYIPSEYKEIKDNSLILLFDGFDEIESKNRLTFIRKLQFFKDNHPISKIVLTSRTNFYSNQLEGFEIYYLDNLTYEDVEKFIDEAQNE